jgi:hypothetical protein
MRRPVLALALAIGVVIATTMPVSALGETSVTLNCSDGTSVQLLVDAATLTNLTASVQAMLDYPADLTCTLIQNPLGGLSFFGQAALASPGKEQFIVGGGRWQVPCSAIFPGGTGGGTPPGLVEGGVVARVPDTSSSWSKVSARTINQDSEFIWVNIAVNVHQKSAPEPFYGSLNETIPAKQFCGDRQVGESHFTSKPTCLSISGNATMPPSQRPAFVTSEVTKASDGSGQVPFPAPVDASTPTASVFPRDIVQFGFQDNGNPPGHNPDPTVTPDSDMLNGVPAAPEGSQGRSDCMTHTQWTPMWRLGTNDPQLDPKQYGNITLHP